MRKTKTLKALVLSMGLGVAMLTTTSAQAQVINLLDEYYDELDQQSSKNAGALLGGNGTRTEVFNEGTFSNEAFGAPLGSGVLFLLAAGIGYATLKKKEDEQ